MRLGVLAQLGPIIVTVAVLIVTEASSGQFAAFPVAASIYNSGAQHEPAVEGSNVFWIEFDQDRFRIRGKDLRTGQLYAPGWNSSEGIMPTVDSGLVIWRERRDDAWGITAYDIQTGREWQIIQPPYFKGRFAGTAGYVVWTDGRDSPAKVPPEYTNYDIYGFDLNTGLEFPVCTAWGTQSYAAASGNIVVWQDHRRRIPPLTGKLLADIYGMDLSTGEEFLIAADANYLPQRAPAISGDTVIWLNGGDIWGYSLRNKTQFPICQSPWGKGGLAIDGRYVAWAEYRNGHDPDIFAYDLLTGQEFPIFEGPGYQQFPAISGDLVVWESYIPGEPAQVYGAYIPEPAPLALMLVGLAILRGKGRAGSTLKLRGRSRRSYLGAIVLRPRNSEP